MGKLKIINEKYVGNILKIMRNKLVFIMLPLKFADKFQNVGFP